MNTKRIKLTAMAGLIMGMTIVSATAVENNGGYLWTRGGPNIRIIAGDGIPDPFTVFPRRVKAQNYVFAITDADSNVLVYTPENTFDLEGAGEGNCLIYGIAYAGEFSMPTGVSVDELTASEGLAVSRNYISVWREGVKSVDGGWIISDGRGRSKVKICLKDPYPVRAYTTSSASSDSAYAYIITDSEGMVLAYPEGNQFDFSGAPPGVCRIYGISYTGALEMETGIPVYEVMSDEGNHELSRNYIRVIRTERCKYH